MGSLVHISTASAAVCGVGEMRARVAQAAAQQVEEAFARHAIGARAAVVIDADAARQHRARASLPRAQAEIELVVIHEEALVESAKLLEERSRDDEERAADDRDLDRAEGIDGSSNRRPADDRGRVEGGASSTVSFQRC